MTMKNLSAVDLNLLVAFDALLTERHVTRAAERIGLSQPALSKALQRLRDVFDDRLFERRDGVMQPTAQALKLSQPVRRALDEIQSALAPRDFDPRRAWATVTLGLVDYYEVLLLPRLMNDLRRSAPGIDLAVKRTDRLRVHEQFAKNEIDFAVVPIPESVTELHVEPVSVEDAVTLMAQGNPLAADFTLERFAAAGHVVVALEGQGVGRIDALLAAQGLQRRVALRLPNFTSVPFIIGGSDLITTLPRHLGTRLAAAAQAICLPPPLPVPPVTIHLAWHPRSAASPLHRWMRARIKAATTDL
jgi:LysR family transcriptional regulator, transcriptional activator of nodD3 and syrA